MVAWLHGCMGSGAMKEPSTKRMISALLLSGQSLLLNDKCVERKEDLAPLYAQLAEVRSAGK